MAFLFWKKKRKDEPEAVAEVEEVVVAPIQEAVPVPAPVVEPVLEPEVEVAPAPEPEPVVLVEPEPEPEPAPEPEPDPEPEACVPAATAALNAVTALESCVLSGVKLATPTVTPKAAACVSSVLLKLVKAELFLKALAAVASTVVLPSEPTVALGVLSISVLK